MEHRMSDATTCRYFTTYSGVTLPFNLTAELSEAETQNRNTFFRGWFDDAGRLQSFQKVVYGEVEQEHRYTYGEDGKLLSAEIVDEDGEVTVVEGR